MIKDHIPQILSGPPSYKPHTHKRAEKAATKLSRRDQDEKMSGRQHNKQRVAVVAGGHRSRNK